MLHTFGALGGLIVRPVGLATASFFTDIVFFSLCLLGLYYCSCAALRFDHFWQDRKMPTLERAGLTVDFRYLKPSRGTENT